MRPFSRARAAQHSSSAATRTCPFSVAIAASLLATWVVYRRVDGDQIERLTATHADMAASATRVPILAPPDGTLGAFVFATGPSGGGLVVAAVTAGSTATLWAVPLVP